MPTKSYGQNFLFDQSLTDKIVRMAGPLKGRTIIEVGPGPGGLTRSLLRSDAEKIIAIEQDKRCEPILETLVEVGGGRFSYLIFDALKLDETTLGTPPFVVVANLPYNVGTLLLLKWLERPDLFQSLTLMFQKEVADRIVAEPGSESYGRLSVLCQWLCETEHHFDISPKAFFPPPKVTSSVITLKPRVAPLYPVDRAKLETLCRVAFGQRRKMLRGSLKQLHNAPEAWIRAAGLDPTIRPEEVSIEAWCKLVTKMENY